MSTMNISISPALKSFVEDRVATGNYGTSSEYVRELIRRDQDRQRLRDLLLEGAASPLTGPMTDEDFAELRRLAAGE